MKRLPKRRIKIIKSRLSENNNNYDHNNISIVLTDSVKVNMASNNITEEKIQHLLQLELTKGNYKRLFEDRNKLVSDFLVDAKRVHDDFFALDLNHNTIAGKSTTVNNFTKLNVENEWPKGASNDVGLFSESFLKLMEDGSKLDIPSSLKQVKLSGFGCFDFRLPPGN